MKRIIVFLALFFGAFNLHAQSNNWLKELGFETGSIAASFRSDTAVCCPNQGWHMDNFTHVKLVNAGDTNVLGWQVAPLDPLGGNHSLRLGYWHNNNPMIRLSDTMRVDSFNYYFRFSLAAIRKSYPGMLSIHGLPYFQLLDLNGNPLSVVNQVYFNGLNKYVRFENENWSEIFDNNELDLLENSFSIEIWFRKLDNNYFLFGKLNSWILNIDMYNGAFFVYLNIKTCFDNANDSLSNTNSSPRQDRISSIVLSIGSSMV
jgi:hypothetical protein